MSQTIVITGFRRTVTGHRGTLVLVGDVTVDLSNPAQAEVDGTWWVDDATGAYAGHTGRGAISGMADFTLTQPRGTLRYAGHLRAGG
jgi:hypothetical protein